MSKNRPARTREEWLKEAIRRFRPIFKEAGIEIPKDVRISIGFGPTGARQENQIILGVTCARVLSEDHRPEIFISPEDAEAVSMLATVAHELIHAWDDCQSGHKGEFKRVAEAIGLQGRMTHTTPSPVFEAELALLADDMGPYPGGRMNLTGGKVDIPVPTDPTAPGPKITSGPRKQTTRMIKRVCQHDPELKCFGYSVRLTQAWLAVGNPKCPNGHEMTA
jgi:hypothetical protein